MRAVRNYNSALNHNGRPNHGVSTIFYRRNCLRGVGTKINWADVWTDFISRRIFVGSNLQPPHTHPNRSL